MWLKETRRLDDGDIVFAPAKLKQTAGLPSHGAVHQKEGKLNRINTVINLDPLDHVSKFAMRESFFRFMSNHPRQY